MSSMTEILGETRVLICAGSGGVGKTTASAAIAAGMAARGKKVAVLTIDPAKRLADSLGLPELGNTERQVDPALFGEAGVDPQGGELWAMMLDPKATFDEVVQQHAPDPETRDRILTNRIYQQLSSALAGSQEYMAMEKLYEIWASDRYDLLVLDTPPSQHALDFLDAPQRLLQFIEGKAIKVFMAPTGFAAKIAGRGAGVAFSVLKRITGVDLLQDLAEFFQAFSGMVGGFQDRAQKVNELLADPQSTFLVVCGPQNDSIEQALEFHAKLADRQLPFGGAVVNKVHYADPGSAESVKEALGGMLDDPDLIGRVVANFTDYSALAERDGQNIKELEADIGADRVIQVPYLDSDVHDLAGLMEVNRYLFATGADERAAIATSG